MDFILQWIDLIFLPLIVVSVQKDQRLISAGFVIGCMIMMRLQVELMHYVGYPNGFLPLMESGVLPRAQITYSLFYIFYAALALYSPNAKGALFMAGALSLFFAALFVSMTVIVL